jgi:hypothetical protein
LQGERVALDVSKLETYRLFPGQVIAVEGVNPTAKKIIAGKVITQLELKPIAPGVPLERQAGMLLPIRSNSAQNCQGLHPGCQNVGQSEIGNVVN